MRPNGRHPARAGKPILKRRTYRESRITRTVYDGERESAV
jgi:hypothetical protein